MIRLLEQKEGYSIVTSISEHEMILRKQNDLYIHVSDSQETTLLLKFPDLVNICKFEDTYIIGNQEAIFTWDLISLNLLIPNRVRISPIFDEDFIITSCADSLSLPVQKNNLISKDVVWESRCLRAFPTKWGILSISSNERSIFLLHLQTGYKMWTVDMTELGRHISWGEEKEGNIIKYLGVFDQIVWLSISGNKVIGVDILTGAIRHQVEDLPEPYSMQIDHRQGKIIGMRKDKLWEIPLDNPTVIMHDLTDEFKALQLETTIGFVFDDDHYYFTDHCKGYVCAIDKGSKKLVWTYRFEHVDPRNWNTALRKIHYANEHLYVPDKRGDLYIMKLDSF